MTDTTNTGTVQEGKAEIPLSQSTVEALKRLGFI